MHGLRLLLLGTLGIDGVFGCLANGCALAQNEAFPDSAEPAPQVQAGLPPQAQAPGPRAKLIIQP
jgi:hypothetical protein